MSNEFAAEKVRRLPKTHLISGSLSHDKPGCEEGEIQPAADHLIEDASDRTFVSFTSPLMPEAAVGSFLRP